MKETIAAMLKVEAQAKEIVAKAQEEADEIVKNARAEAAVIQNTAQRNAQAESVKIIKEGLEQARKRREEILAEIDTKAGRLRHITQEKAEAAKELILAALTGQ